MYCNHCGKLNDDKANFCTQCGQQLTREMSTPIADKPTPPAPAPSRFTLKPDHGFFAIALTLVIGHAGWYYWRENGFKDVLKHETLYKTIYFLYVGSLVVQFVLLTIYTRNIILKIIIGILGLIICYSEIQQMQDTINDIFNRKKDF
jgi:hypothetical protein